MNTGLLGLSTGMAARLALTTSIAPTKRNASKVEQTAERGWETANVICPLCERGETRAYVFSDTFGTWGGKPGFVVEGLVGEECPVCEAVTISPEQCRVNRDKIAAERERLGL